MNIRPLIGLVCVFVLTLSARAAESARYIILLDNGTRVAGHEIDQTRDDGLSTIHFVFKDNGRGPESDEEYRIGADGMLSDYKIKGHTTFGSLISEHMPLDIQRSTRVAQMKIPDDKTAARYRKSFDKMVEFVGRMYKAGIPLVAGTDDIPGFVLHSELENYVKAGLTPAQALQIATWNGALYTRTLNDRGSIAPGKLADLLIIEGDPTVNIADIRKVNMVITQGQWLSPTEIYQRMGVKPFVQDSVGVRSLEK